MSAEWIAMFSVLFLALLLGAMLWWVSRDEESL